MRVLVFILLKLAEAAGIAALVWILAAAGMWLQQYGDILDTVFTVALAAIIVLFGGCGLITLIVKNWEWAGRLAELWRRYSSV